MLTWLLCVCGCAGHVTLDVNQAVCDACAPGSYAASNQSACIPCDPAASEFQNASAAQNCRPATTCNAGSYVSQALSSSSDRTCAACAPGT